jgi:trans-aconitate methyltransferase
MSDPTEPKSDINGDLYCEEYFEGLRWRVEPSVARLVPLVIESFTPSSAIDLGCGDGQWTVALAQRGVTTHGVDTAQVQHPSHAGASFGYGDLTALKPNSLGRADLCLCLEVAEHLPESSAESLVALAESCSPIVVFSAATPGQGGTGHLNEQPHHYWIERFANVGMTADVTWRGAFAMDESVAPWYRENIVIFTRSGNGN